MVLAVRLTHIDTAVPLRGLRVADEPDKSAPADWVRVQMHSASINFSDVATIRGFGVQPADLPLIVGSDGAGIDEHGNEVIVYPIVNHPDYTGTDPMLDPHLRMLSQGIDGTFTRQTWVPPGTLVRKPAELSWESAASLGTAWLTAYRMLFGDADVRPGETILVHGAGGGVSTALILLARAAEITVWVSSRDPGRGTRAVNNLGANRAFTTGAILPGRVDAVMDCVGASTFDQSLGALRAGGRLVVVGAVGGSRAELDLTDLFRRSITIIGSAMGSPNELARLAAFCVEKNLEPPVHSIWPITHAQHAFEAFGARNRFGKILIDCAVNSSGRADF